MITSLVVVEIVKYYGVETGSTVIAEENLFSGDRYINLIVREPITEVNSQIRIKPDSLLIKENSAELCLGIELYGEESNKNLPLKYKIYDQDDNLLYDGTSERYDEFIQAEKFWGVTFWDTILLEDYKIDNTYLIFELYDKDDVLLSTFDIDTRCNEFKCQVDNQFEQLSEIDLRYFLGSVARVGNTRDGENFKEENLISLAIELSSEKIEKVYLPADEKYYWNNNERPGYLVEDVENVIKSFYGISMGEIELDYDYEKVEKDGKEYYTYKVPPCGSYSSSSCLDIKNISYSDGKYNITYDYWIQGEQTEFEFDDMYNEVYEKNIVIEKNEDGAPSKFKILSISSNEE